jgi:hypothetical protein
VVLRKIVGQWPVFEVAGFFAGAGAGAGGVAGAGFFVAWAGWAGVAVFATGTGVAVFAAGTGVAVFAAGRGCIATAFVTAACEC